MKKNIFLTFVLVASMVLSLAQSLSVRAAPSLPDRTPPVPDPLGEVIEYYGRLGDIKGTIGVVVEFSGKPAAVVYAEAKERVQELSAASAIAKTQINLVDKEQNTFMSALRSQGINASVLYRTQRVYNGIAMYIDAKDVAALAKMPGVKAIHPLIPKEIDHTTSVPLIQALQVWAGSAQYQGQGIKIGIIDTGIDYIHTNFGGPGDYTGQDYTTLSEAGNLFPTAKVVGGWDFAGDNYNAAGTGAQLTPVPDPDPMDCNGHGSHVAGTAAGFGVLTDGSTYVESGSDTYANLVGLSASAYQSKFRIGPGVAPKAELYALRVFGCAGSTALTDLAIEWAMDPNRDGDLSDHLDVINMSLGSSFGTQYDSSAVASNNAALAGVLVVASAGNSGDVYYITGAPAVAQRAISVASSQDSSAVVGGFTAVSTSNPAINGTYPAGTAAFGPQTYNVTAAAVVAAPYQACSALTNPSAVAGKIVLVQRGVCTFKTKALNAQNAGAIGVLLVNNAAGFPPGMADDASITTPITIPVMSARDVDGAAIKAVLDGGGDVTLTLDSSLESLAIDPTLQDKISSFTSRGVARGGSYLKPDLTAPGDTIYSTATGTGNKGASFSGTSMAAPHVAGVMAILRQQRPTWSVEDLKALVMNTATDDVWNAAGTLRNTPTRVGAGRVSVLRATQSDVVAFNADNPELVSVPFGVVKVVNTGPGVDQTLTKTVTVKNTGASAETYNVAFVSRYAANTGITFSLLDASDNPVSSVTVPAGGTATIKVRVALDAASLAKTLDPTVITGNRSTIGEAGGFVQLTSTGSAPTLRVPVHIAARAASAMDVTETSLSLPSTSGTVSLTPSGTPVDLASDFSIASVFELLGTSPALSGLPVPTLASADLQYIGAMSNYPAVAWSSARIFFGVSTHAPWDTLYSTEFDIYIDTNEDGVDDYVVYNYDTGAGTATRNDTFATVVVNLNTLSGVWNSYVNLYSGGLNTNVFNNNVAVLPIGVTSIGLNETNNTDFDFYIVTYHRESDDYVDISDVYHYDVKNKAFNSTNPAIGNSPFWFDDPAYSPAFNIAYNTAYMSANTQGLLVLHHHNAANTAEVVPLAFPTVTSIVRANANPTNAASVDFTVTFSESVTGVDAADFSLTPTGSISGASVTGVTGTGSTYTVTVNTGTGSGTLRLDIPNTATIASTANTLPLGGLPYTAGAAYDVDKGAPSVVSILRHAPASQIVTSGASVTYRVTFSEDVTGVDVSDFALTLLSVPGTNASLSSVTPVSASVYDVTVDITGLRNAKNKLDGAIRLDVAAAATITDLVGNALSGLPYTGGQIYSVVQEQSFSDVATSYWAWQFIERLFYSGITTGCGATTYCPTSPVTRDQMAVFLLRSIHGAGYIPPAVGGSTGFADVPATHWAAAWIKQLAAEGITTGCGGGNYCPSNPVTREQMAVFLLRAKYGAAYTPPAVGSGTGFGDVPATHWAAAWIKQLAAEGITTGCGGGNYCPATPVSRDQMAVFLVRTFNLP